MAINHPDVIPMIAYEDGPKAMDWLSSAFGFKERARMLDTNGRLSHGEMQAGDGVIMLATPTPDYQAPRHHREACESAIQGVLRAAARGAVRTVAHQQPGGIDGGGVQAVQRLPFIWPSSSRGSRLA